MRPRYLVARVDKKRLAPENVSSRAFRDTRDYAYSSSSLPSSSLWQTYLISIGLVGKKEERTLGFTFVVPHVERTALAVLQMNHADAGPIS